MKIINEAKETYEKLIDSKQITEPKWNGMYENYENDIKGALNVLAVSISQQSIPVTPIVPVTPSPTSVPQPPDIGIAFTTEDVLSIANHYSAAIKDPQTAAKIQKMNSYELITWMAEQIGKPIVTPVQHEGKTHFEPIDTSPPTPEEIADFEDEFT